jgi:hypothetical protein
MPAFFSLLCAWREELILHQHQVTPLALSLALLELPLLLVSQPRRSLRRCRGSSSWRRPSLPSYLTGGLADPNSGPNRAMVSSSFPRPPSPAKGATEPARFQRAAPSPPPRHPIARGKFFPGSNLWTRGIFVIDQNCKGPVRKTKSLIVIDFSWVLENP